MARSLPGGTDGTVIRATQWVSAEATRKRKMGELPERGVWKASQWSLGAALLRSVHRGQPPSFLWFGVPVLTLILQTRNRLRQGSPLTEITPVRAGSGPSIQPL